MKRSLEEMSKPFFISNSKSLIKTTIACFLILIVGGSNLFAQYKGSPVRKKKLIQVLRSKRLPSRDIVTIINSNGVDFQLTPAIRKELVAAGARPAVIKAVLNNSRAAAGSKRGNIAEKAETNSLSRKKKTSTVATYNNLLGQAMDSYKKQGNLQDAIRLLGEATRLEPKNPAAYQSLGFIFLYGFKDFAQAEKYMNDAIRLGGSAEFRVFHDDNEIFTQMCQGSLFISRDNVRFESDNKMHAFTTGKSNVSEVKIDNITTPLWIKRSVYKIVLRTTGKEPTKFRFSPFSEKQQESEIVKRLARKA